jgi:hypothetical protein
MNKKFIPSILFARGPLIIAVAIIAWERIFIAWDCIFSFREGDYLDSRQRYLTSNKKFLHWILRLKNIPILFGSLPLLHIYHDRFTPFYCSENQPHCEREVIYYHKKEEQ